MHAWGGFSYSEDDLAIMYFDTFYSRNPTADDLVDFKKNMDKTGLSCGAWWLETPEAIERVSEKLKDGGKRLSQQR